MTPKELMQVALEGKMPNTMPVVVPYIHFYLFDHFSEITGRPKCEVREWLACEPEVHINGYRNLFEKTPFDWITPYETPSREQRKSLEFYWKDGKYFREDHRNNTEVEIDQDFIHNTYTVNETCFVFDKKDADQHIIAEKAEDAIKAQ